jgi:hypothetical protein
MPAPSFPHLTDEYEPTNTALWEKVLEVARGDKEELTIGNRTIHKPDEFSWPSPPGSAWAVKQYKGFGGNWRRKSAAQQDFQRHALRILLAGGLVTSHTYEEYEWMTQLQQRRLAHQVQDKGKEQLWDAGPRLLLARDNRLSWRIARRWAKETSS